MIDELAEPEYDESGEHPEAYARWLKTLNKRSFEEENDEAEHQWDHVHPNDNDFDCKSTKVSACRAEYSSRKAADPFYFNSDRD